jgi:hypothetical protein
LRGLKEFIELYIDNKVYSLLYTLTSGEDHSKPVFITLLLILQRNKLECSSLKSFSVYSNDMITVLRLIINIHF